VDTLDNAGYQVCSTAVELVPFGDGLVVAGAPEHLDVLVAGWLLGFGSRNTR
jgi:hypothetical protein